MENGAGTAIMNALAAPLGFLALNIILCIPVSKIFYKGLKNSNGANASGYIVISLLLAPLLLLGCIISMVRYSKTIKNVIDPAYSKVQANPINSTVD